MTIENKWVESHRRYAFLLHLGLRFGFCLLGLLFLTGCAVPVRGAWPQWGGPNGDFKVHNANLSEQWPPSGLKQLWERGLGDGFSSIVAEADSLYTMYREGDEEIVIALRASDGNRLWAHRYPVPLRTEKRDGYLGNDPALAGSGPRATPLLAGNCLYTVGYTARLCCLDKTTGKLLWSRDLIGELQGWVHECGYSSSPVAYQNKVILLLGSKEHAVVAFEAESGGVAWTSPPFQITAQESQGFHATPMFITVEGQNQLVFMSPTEVIGIDPANGHWKWSHPHRNQLQYNCVTPIGGTDGLLYVTSHSRGGSRGLQLSRKEGETVATQLWYEPRIGLHHNNGIRLGDYLYGCAGLFLYAQNVRTGEVAWKQRGFSEANLIYADGRMIVLDEKGVLALARVSPEKLTIHSKLQLFREDEGQSWTPPTLVGTKLYLRNRHRIIALELP